MRLDKQSLSLTIYAVLFFLFGNTTFSLGKPSVETIQEYLQKIQMKSSSLQELISPKQGLLYLRYEEDSPEENKNPIQIETHLCGKKLAETLPEVEEIVKRHLDYGVKPVCRIHHKKIVLCEATIQMEYGSRLTFYFILSKMNQLRVRAITVEDFAASPKIMRREQQKIQQRLRLWWKKACP